MLPPSYVTINQNLSPILQVYTPSTTIPAENISEKFPSFLEKLALCAKLVQKWFCWDFEVLPLDYEKINLNFSPVAQIYSPNTTVLAKKNFWKFSQFLGKTHIVCRIGTKMALLRF